MHNSEEQVWVDDWLDHLSNFEDYLVPQHHHEKEPLETTINQDVNNNGKLTNLSNMDIAKETMKLEKPAPNGKNKKIKLAVKKFQVKPTGVKKKCTNPYNLVFDVKEYNPRWQAQEKPTEEEAVEKKTGTWSPDEIERFILGYNTLGKRWKKIATHFVKTRTTVQVGCFAQKFLHQL